MKKSIIFLATSAIVFVGCSQNDSIKETVSNDAPIAFTSYAQSTTKAENNGKNYSWELKDHHSDFYVYGYKTVGTTITKVFDKQLVEWNNPAITPEDWNYTPARYWDKAASQYYFYAAAPKDTKWTLNSNTAVVDDDYFTYASYSLSDHDATLTGNAYVESFDDNRANAVDLMIADKCPWTNLGATVNLQFIHILSRLNVLIKRGDNLDANDVVTLLDFKVFKMYNGGSFDEHLATAVNTTPGINTRWTGQTGTVDYTAANEADIVVGDGTTKQYILQSLVVPQNIVWKSILANGTDAASCSAPEAYFMIKYKIANNTWTGDKEETYEAYYNLAAAFGATADDTSTNDKKEDEISFTEGWQNNLTLIINPDKIEFDAKVSEWDDRNFEYSITEP